MSRFSRVTTVIMLASSIGLHWVLLQSVAWMGVLVTYSVESNFGDAVVKTFDGEHPCKLGVSVNQGKSSEKRQQALKGLQKIVFVVFETETMLCPSTFVALRLRDWQLPDLLTHSPPTSPPRTV